MWTRHVFSTSSGIIELLATYAGATRRCRACFKDLTARGNNLALFLETDKTNGPKVPVHLLP